MGFKACERFFHKFKNISVLDPELQKAFKTFLQNGNGSARCGHSWADTWYIPQRCSQSFIKLAQVAHDSRLLSEIAVNNIISSLDYKENIENLNGQYLRDLGVKQRDSIEPRNFWIHYNFNVTFMHAIKYNTPYKRFNIALIKNWIIPYKNGILQC